MYLLRLQLAHPFLEVREQVPADLFRSPIVRRRTLSVEAGTHARFAEPHALLTRMVEGLRLHVGEGRHLRLASVFDDVLDNYRLDLLMDSLPLLAAV